MIQRGRRPGDFNQIIAQVSNMNLKPIRPHKFKDDRSGKFIRTLFPLAIKIFDLPESYIESFNHLATKSKEYEFKRIISEVPNSWKTLQEVYKLDLNWTEKLENDLEILYKPGEYCREVLYEKLLKSIFEYLKKWKSRKNKENDEKQVKLGNSQNSLRDNQEVFNKTASFGPLIAKGIVDEDPDWDLIFANQSQLNHQNE